MLSPPAARQEIFVPPSRDKYTFKIKFKGSGQVIHDDETAPKEASTMEHFDREAHIAEVYSSRGHTQAVRAMHSGEEKVKVKRKGPGIFL